LPQSASGSWFHADLHDDGDGFSGLSSHHDHRMHHRVFSDHRNVSSHRHSSYRSDHLYHLYDQPMPVSYHLFCLHLQQAQQQPVSCRLLAFYPQAYAAYPQLWVQLQSVQAGAGAGLGRRIFAIISLICATSSATALRAFSAASARFAASAASCLRRASAASAS
jgi:hypothetical protein